MKNQEFNYHTHTSLCGHADGEIDEYVQKAIEGGIKQLGFSDHTPNVLGKSDKNHEMSMQQFEQIYIPKLKEIKEKYAKKIDIKIGIEAEYFGDIGERHPLVKDFREKTEPKLEYMILGQHSALKRDENGDIKMPPHSADPKAADYPIDYALTVVEAIKSRKFAYVAHPDIFMEKRELVLSQDKALYEKNVKKATEMICETAREYDIPLEINLGSISAIEAGAKQALRDGSYAYPVPDFWRIAQEKGCKVLIGVDAHSPNALMEKKNEEIAKRLIESSGIELNYLENFEPKGIGHEGKEPEKTRKENNILFSAIEAGEGMVKSRDIKEQEKNIERYMEKSKNIGEI